MSDIGRGTGRVGTGAKTPVAPREPTRRIDRFKTTLLRSSSNAKYKRGQFEYDNRRQDKEIRSVHMFAICARGQGGRHASMIADDGAKKQHSTTYTSERCWYSYQYYFDKYVTQRRFKSF